MISHGNLPLEFIYVTKIRKCPRNKRNPAALLEKHLLKLYKQKAVLPEAMPPVVQQPPWGDGSLCLLHVTHLYQLL